MLWVDLSNAYGSIDYTFTMSPVLSRTWSWINNFSVWVTSEEVPSDWHQLEKERISEFIISVILFALLMNMVVKSAEVESRGPLTHKCIHGWPHCYSNISPRSEVDLARPGKTWAKMNFKPTKSRSMVLRSGEVVDKFCFSVSSQWGVRGSCLTQSHKRDWKFPHQGG